MAITVKCRFCKKTYDVRDSLAGKSVVCKKCGEAIAVPAAESGGRSDRRAAPTEAYVVKGEVDDDPRPAVPQKSRNAPEERLLPRGTGGPPVIVRGKSSGNPQMLWLVGGAGLVLLVAVVLIVTSVGPSPEPFDQAAQPARFHAVGNSPPAVPTVSANRPVDPTVARARSSPASKPKPGTPKAASPEIDKPDNAVAGESVSEKSRPDVVIDVDAWEVKVDPADEPVEIDAKKKIYATFPKNSSGDVVYPDCPSPYVALGSNRHPNEFREVRDVRANRRVGSIRGSVIFNARTALSPDGLFFAAWAKDQNRIGIWDVKAEQLHGVVIPRDNTSPRLLMFAGVERLIAVGDGDEVLAWSLPDGKPERAIPLPKVTGNLVAGLTPGGRFLAVAAGTATKPFVRVFNLATGDTAGEIKLDFHDERAPVCRAVAFSPDGVELAVLYEAADKANLVVVRVASGKLAARIRIDEKIQTAMAARSDTPWRALEWFPSRKRWLVDGRGVVDRSKESIIWRMPDDEDNVVAIRRVLDDRHFLTMGVEKNEPAIIAVELRGGDLER